MTAQKQSIERSWQAIDALDFSRIKAKLLHGKSTHWSPESLADAEAGYRRFLKLAAKYPDTPVVPSEQVDAFWHAHIVDTRRYASDCEHIFGHVLHHDPYVGIDGPQDEARLRALAEASARLGAREFGLRPATAAYCAVTNEGKPALSPVPAAVQAAYCAITNGTQAAYCAITSGVVTSSGRDAPSPAGLPRH
ncbi:glycine-rich domain-containing protein [Cupriavidus sp. PET2-C1]